MGYLLRRIAATLPVMAVVAVIVFLLIHLSPGDPAALIAGDLATADDIARLRTTLGLDEPLWRQFLLWSGRLMQGDFGTSIFTQVPVTTLLAQRIEPTLSIAALTMLLAVGVAVPLGTLAAYTAGRWIDRLVMVFAVLAFSVPVFMVGYLLVYVFAIQLPWLPVQGYVRLGEGGVGRLVIDSVQRHDYPVIQSVLLLSAGVYVLINLLIDLSYRWFDPRINY